MNQYQQRPPYVRTDFGSALRFFIFLPFMFAAVCFIAAIPFGILVEIGLIGS